MADPSKVSEHRDLDGSGGRRKFLYVVGFLATAFTGGILGAGQILGSEAAESDEELLDCVGVALNYIDENEFKAAVESGQEYSEVYDLNRDDEVDQDDWELYQDALEGNLDSQQKEHLEQYALETLGYEC